MRKYGKWLIVLGILAANPAWVSADGFLGGLRSSQSRSNQKEVNQQKAEQVAQALRQARLNGYDLEVEVVGDAVKLDGKVRDASHRALAESAVRQVPGITRVQNNLQYVPGGNVQQTAGNYSDHGLTSASYSVVEGSQNDIQQVRFQKPGKRKPSKPTPSRQQQARPQQTRPQQQTAPPKQTVGFGEEPPAVPPALTPPKIVMDTEEPQAQKSVELTASSRTAAPARSAGPANQEVAQMIADSLGNSGLGAADIEVRYQDGVATLLGSVPTMQQHQMAAVAASRVPYVTDVQNRLQLTSQVSQTAYAPQQRVSPVSMNMVQPPMQAGGPMPVSAAGAGVYSNPQLPSHAWPAYAQYPNSAAIQYPTQHSASAFPYIGPFYPYPQVPLGWREVSLQWDDGFWQLDFQKKKDAWYWLFAPRNWH